MSSELILCKEKITYLPLTFLFFHFRKYKTLYN